MVIIGYTQYFRRVPELPQEKFNQVKVDVKKIIDACNEAGIKICGSDGTGLPLLTQDLIAFNGDANCGHKQRDLGITWPSDNAGGVDAEEGNTEGSWYGGAQLATRTCGGNCDHESAWMDRIREPNYPQEQLDEKGMYFEFCKTAYKPYDIAVTAFLIIAKHHLGELIEVSSDGDNKDWFDAKVLCDKVLGYGLNYEIDEEEGILRKILPVKGDAQNDCHTDSR